MNFTDINTGILDVDGKEIFVGNKIAQTNFNGEPYEALYEVVIDERDNQFCLKMLKGNQIAMHNRGLSAFGTIINGKLKKGRVVIIP